MTTLIEKKSFLFAFYLALCGLFALPFSLLAQQQLLPDAASLPNLLNAPLADAVVATTTTATTTLTALKQVVPWFAVEQLTGDFLAMGDFVVGPGRAELSIQAGESVTYMISVANRISDNRVFEITVEDIEGSPDATRSVVLLGDTRGPYTIRDYITFPEQTFTLDLGERARIPVTITIPPDAEPGGFYGSVLISTVQAAAETGAVEAARSPVIARIGTLFFVTVPGEVEQAGMLKGISFPNAAWWYEAGPITLSLLYENTGSVHLNPYGELRVKNLFGEEVGFAEIEPWFVLPQSVRSRDVVWNREVLFGRYEATVSINRGYNDEVDTKTIVFWVMPWKIVAAVFTILFLLLLAVRTLARNFEFKRKR